MEIQNNIKTLSINVPAGYEIDEKNSTFKCIVFKKINRWRDTEDDSTVTFMSGSWIENETIVSDNHVPHIRCNRNVFATRKLAIAALAMARLSQIIANDKRFGGTISDEEWENVRINKYVIKRLNNKIKTYTDNGIYSFLAFHTEEQRTLFLEENEDLIKKYLMI